MNMLDLHGPWSLGLLSFAVSAVLLWLGGGLAAASRGRAQALSWDLAALGAVLVACAIWWPALRHPAPGSWAAAAGSQALWAWGLGLAWAVSTQVTATFATRRMPLAFLGLAMLSVIAGYLHAMTVLPQALGSRAVFGQGVFALAPVFLSAALVAVQAGHAARSVQRRWRAGGALGGALVLALAAAGGPADAAAAAVSLPEGLFLGALLLTAAVLQRSLQEPTTPHLPALRRAHAHALAALDSLTQLPTRVQFETRLDEAAKACAAKGGRLALLFIDLDGFKPVNDTFGHRAGDQVLEQVGRRLAALAGRRCFGARVGGDEFLLLLTGVDSEDGVVQAARKVIAALGQPYKIDDREVNVSCSIGIALYPDDCSPAALIARADAAMYAAKRAGGASHCIYTPALDADARETNELLGDLRQALARKEFELFYQPKIDTKTGQVTAAEALLRWRHPTRGLLLPGTFVHVAERFGLIGAIGGWVIDDACRQGREWRDKGLRMRVAINLSAHQMRQDDIADRITEALQRYRIHPSLLTCEITETAAMEDTKATQETFRRLGELGAHLSIDDFGTGHSSLAYLRKLPAEELKIDRSFVMDIEHSVDARAIVDAVVKLAHALGLKVVAEGVENPRQQQVLTQMGCDELQGFLFARPMSARALLMWAMRDRSESAEFRASLFGETREAPSLTAARHARAQSARRGAGPVSSGEREEETS
jgi:diguanylate cyclase (GGDEF)-like protein